MKSIPDILPQLISDMEKRSLKINVDNQVGVGINRLMKIVHIIYIESGSFSGGEEAVFNAGIEYDEDCVAIKLAQFEEIKNSFECAESMLRAILSRIDSGHIPKIADGMDLVGSINGTLEELEKIQ